MVLVSFISNFLVFVYSYNRLATPFINEEQRVENADFIMTVSISMFACAALIIGAITYFILKKHNN